MPSTVLAGCVPLITAVGIACLVGGLAFAIGPSIERRLFKKETAHLSSPFIALLLIPIVCLASYWILASYLYSGMYPPSPRQKPEVQDIVGDWQFPERSLQILQEQGYKIESYLLRFKADNTFTMTNMPALVTYMSNKGWYTTGSGTWRFITSINGDWQIVVLFTELNYAPVEDTTTAAYFDILGNEPPYKLYKYISDPDEGRIITLERH